MPEKPLIGIQAQISPERNPFVDARYVALVREAGGLVFVFPPVTSAEEARAVVSRCDGILLPGGDDMDPAMYGQERLPVTDAPVPERDFGEPLLIRAALAADKPFLGICRGHQMLQVTLDGPMIQDIPSQFSRTIDHRRTDVEGETVHPVTCVENSPLALALGAAGLPCAFGVNSVHHQAIASPLADGLSPMATAPDGLIEAVYMPGRNFVWGVQWHPEMIPNHPVSRIIARELILAAQRQNL